MSRPRPVRTEGLGTQRRNSEMLVGLILRRLLQEGPEALVHLCIRSGTTTRYLSMVDPADGLRHPPPHIKVLATWIVHLPSSRTASTSKGFAPPRDRAVQKRHMGLPEGPVVGCFGRIRAGKGTGDFLSRRCSTALPAVPGTVAIIMGRATPKHWTYKRKLPKPHQICGAPRPVSIFCRRFRATKIADWYKAIDLLVAPQRWEGFGLTPLRGHGLRGPSRCKLASAPFKIK